MIQKIASKMIKKLGNIGKIGSKICDWTTARLLSNYDTPIKQPRVLSLLLSILSLLSLREGDVEELEGEVVGVGIIVDRSNGNVILHENQFSIVKLEVQSFDENEIPEDLAKIPIEKPGSRSLKS